MFAWQPAGAMVVLVGLLAGSAASLPNPRAAAAESRAPAAARLLYVSDWSGTKQIYATDPSRRRATAQLTFGRAPVCRDGSPCGFVLPRPSPNGRRLAYWDTVEQGRCSLDLFVAGADGRSRRSIRVEPLCPWEAEAVLWSPDSRRLVYRTRNGLRVRTADGRGDRPVPGSSEARDGSATWSPDGRALAFTSESDLVVSRGGPISPGRPTSRPIAADATAVSWSPRGDWIAHGRRGGGIWLVRPDGTRPQPLAASAEGTPAWSRDGRFLAWSDGFVDLATGVVRSLGSTEQLAWSPRRPILAVARQDGIAIVDAARGTERLLAAERALELGWSPDGELLAYVGRLSERWPFLWPYGPGDLRVVRLTGGVRTLVAAAGRYGGDIQHIVWTRPPEATRYRAAAPRALATVSTSELVASSPIVALAADGDQVAYVSCGHVFIWTPRTASVVQREPSASLGSACPSRNYYVSRAVYSLAVSAGRVAFGLVGGGIGRYWWLGGLTTDGRLLTLGGGTGTQGTPLAEGAVGEAVGSGPLLVFSSWREGGVPGGDSIFTKEQTIHRVDGETCPCPALRTEPGPLVPFDADANRIVAGGDNATLLLDDAGRELLSIPVRSLAAELDGVHLVLLVPGELRGYDAGSGQLLRTYRLPDVPAGRDCASPNTYYCLRPRLRIQDAARGLMAYVLDEQVHLFRLTDGADAVVASGTYARFLADGLVYADGARIRLVAFDRLPLR